MGSRFRGVVFDFDGVIAKSMEQHAEAYRRILAPYDLQPTDRDIFLQEGARSETIIRDALRSIGQEDPEEVARLSKEKQKAFRALGTPGLYPGARELVAGVHEACDKTALVTGTRRENLDRIIPDLLPHFSTVLAQDSYTHDKPHPEPFQKAADALGLEPDQCIVLENAIRGVQSAKAAGYGHVVAITTTLEASDLEEADAVVPDHEAALEEILARLDARDT